jgi:alpha-mannosidase
VVCTPSLQDSRATFEIPFAALERPANGNEVPALRWADLSDGTYGLSLLNNGKYGYHAHYHTLGMTLVRSSYDPDPLPDKGQHRFTYSLYPHAGTWREAGSIQRAAELNQPLLWRIVEGGQAGTLKPGETLLTCTSESVLVSALKLAEDQPQAGAQVIVRLYETQGRRSHAIITSSRPIQHAEETNLIEDRKRPLPVLGDHQTRLSFKPHQIRTVRLRYSL